MKPSMFIGSFNMNGKVLAQNEAMKWIQHQKISTDMVIVSLQECPTHPDHVARAGGDSQSTDGDCDDWNSQMTVDLVVGKQIPYTQTFSSTTSCGSTKDEIQQTIKSSLSPEHILLADIAMGEDPSPKGVAKSCTFYGYIRLLIFAKEQIISGLLSICAANDKPMPLLIPIFAPAGHKSGTPHGDAYPNNFSPDKGGVCIAIPALEILICSMHLCGTNKYNMPERVFDEIRFKQLDVIVKKCDEVLIEKCEHIFTTSCTDGRKPLSETSLFQKYQHILCGDLNFRVEIFSNPADKHRGGRDFHAVHDVLQEGNHESVKNLFNSHDRLVHLLLNLRQKKKDLDAFVGLTENVKRMIENMKDVFLEAPQGTVNGDDGMLTEIVFPTFTFDTNKVHDRDSSTLPFHPRIYSDKRTPSWTDRILVGNPLFEKGYFVENFGATFSISSSDHVPVFATLNPNS